MGFPSPDVWTSTYAFKRPPPIPLPVATSRQAPAFRVPCWRESGSRGSDEEAKRVPVRPQRADLCCAREHSLRAEFVAVDHRLFRPRVLATVRFRVGP